MIQDRYQNIDLFMVLIKNQPIAHICLPLITRIIIGVKRYIFAGVYVPQVRGAEGGVQCRVGGWGTGDRV